MSNETNLCISCNNEFVTCKSNHEYSCGIGNDNVISCDSYIKNNRIYELATSVRYWKDHYKNMHDLASDLQMKIDAHNKECIDTCGDKTRCGYAGYKRRCPDCPRDWMIE